MTYGEVDFLSIAQVFKFIQNTYNAFSEPGGIFVDIGSGTGKGVLTGCLMHQFEECNGIEILESLHSMALLMKKQYDDMVSNPPPEFTDVMKTHKKMPEFKVFQEDILCLDWSNATFVLANSTCFE
jgi:16S rRNA A1518/A1519 N6-dimethyltransferase RsmA/KsgA/DIM1 with predicted DNA glycosylase/AP lyase activity